MIFADGRKPELQSLGMVSIIRLTIMPDASLELYLDYFVILYVAILPKQRKMAIICSKYFHCPNDMALCK